jgi:hypothetical protein
MARATSTTAAAEGSAHPEGSASVSAGAGDAGPCARARRRAYRRPLYRRPLYRRPAALHLKEPQRKRESNVSLIARAKPEARTSCPAPMDEDNKKWA